MAQITWKCASGQSYTIDASVGKSLMEIARDHDVSGIDGDCGGSLSYGTCHVVVSPQWADKTGKPNPMEDDMLDMVETGRTRNRRLSCQIVVTAELDGLVVEVP